MSVVEEWRPYRDGTYSVSSLGRVRRDKPSPFITATSTVVGRIKSVKSIARGYYNVTLNLLSDNGRKTGRHVHRMVAEVFIGPKPPGMFIDHINGVKLDNRACNLEYVTHQENVSRAGKLGLRARGESHGMAKLTAADVVAIRAAASAGERRADIAARHGVSTGMVNGVVARRFWQHVP